MIVADQTPGEPRKMRTSVKGPLMFSAFFAVLAFVAVLIFASGGSARAPRFDLAFTGAGIAFIVSLVVAAMLSMSHKENAEHLGKGSGVNLSSKRPGHGGPAAPGSVADETETPDGGH
ncbi:hypothetical protein [Arthrobacter sp. StoSoilB13]|uniref:hypothetical protein n=1 Tax=Arthrobacter sp. StoSoilB13 TaxID=2830993 RepID=UPI001CC4D344|nr:hypothetical protein [Arthrobacter sp. StoSoilB13]BCW50406.1 hypothetical protein StoSoilB13_27480 [Arthrobacter sp. StoSoilB13]